ncbi:hypothetical protein [Pseudomonas batumici]|uniref:hypothetical protein n=1 Tax=Pseudomonas batumici TaxID=226910 RepID=UPI0012EE82CF|nr:hypothetical protein [Pseudomonas batumici]
MELYDDAHTAVNDFSVFQGRFLKVRNGFEDFFANFNPEKLNIRGISAELDTVAGTCVFNAYGRKFMATLTPLLINKTPYGNIEFLEVIEKKRISIERFLITYQQNITTLAGETLMPASDFSNVQTCYILNLLNRGLSRPITSADY